MRLGPLGQTMLQAAYGIAAGAAGLKDVPSLFAADDPLKDVWLARKLFVHLPEQEPRLPRLIASKATETGRHLIYLLPVGLAPSTILDALEVVGTALQGEAEGWYQDGRLHIVSLERPLPTKVEWSEALAAEASGPLSIVVGASRAGTEVLDLAKGPNPHLLVGGATGTGKSVFLRQLLATLIHLHPPEELRLHLVDLKGGVEFSAFRDSILTESFATDFGQIWKVFHYLNETVDKRMVLFRQAGVENIIAYNKENKLPWHLLVVDELAELSPAAAADKEERAERAALHAHLSRLYRVARFAGVHAVVATQRPDRDALPGQMKANIGATVALRVRNAVNSQILLDHDRAAYLPPVPGRAIYQGEHEREVQTPYISLDEARSIVVKRGLRERKQSW